MFDAQTIADEADDALLGTCRDLTSWLEQHYDILTEEEHDAVRELMTIEECQICGWWHECGELVDDDDEVVGCSNSREQTDEEE